MPGRLSDDALLITGLLVDTPYGDYNYSKWCTNRRIVMTTKTMHPQKAVHTRRATSIFQPGTSIGSPYDSHLAAAALVQAGLSFAAIGRLQKSSGLTLDRIKQVVRISEGSFARRKQSGRLSQDESERLLRLSRVFERAIQLFDGDQAGALQWLETPIPALGDNRPLDLARTEPGAREVEDLIGRIEHGVVS
jgi:putative toxin-antitoxin system antitoxin component (TIGR02293 family)